MSVHRLARRAPGPAPVRAALGLVLLLALLSLGLGAVWSRGGVEVPNPTAWIIALGIFTLAFMFVERLAFLERSAREGNLIMAHGSYRHWLATALVSLALIGALTAVIPMKQARERATDARAGSASVDARDMWSPDRSFTQPPNPLSGATASVTAALQSVPKALLPLLLILLLLLLAVIIIWGFRRSRAARWLLRQIAWFLGLIPRAWRRIRSWLRRLAPPSTQRPTPETGPPADPLLDPFEHPETLAGLTAREIVIRTYHLLLNFAEMLGHGRNRGQTPFEYAGVLSRYAPDAHDAVLALTWAYAGAMYGGENASIPDPAATRDFWQRASASLTSGLTEDDLALRRRAYLAALAVARGSD